MKFSHIALLSLLAFAGICRAAHAQQSTSPGTLVAVVDIAKVFEAHPQFKANMEAIEQQVKQLETQMAAQQKEIASASKRLKDLNTSSKDYQDLEAKLTHQMAGLQMQARRKKAEFLEREAREYYSAYTDILNAVQKIASTYRIGLVLRYDSRPIDPANAQSVAQGVQRAIVLQRNLDITGLVITELTGKTTGAAETARGRSTGTTLQR